MAQTEDFLNDDRTTPNTTSGRDSREIRSEIDRTRAEMDETFAALDSKLTPSQIGQELWHLFKGGSTAGAGKLWRVAREHPMPAAVIGVGLGWMLVQSSKKNGRTAGPGAYRTGYAGTYGATGSGQPGRDGGEGVLSAATDKVRDLAGSARETVSDAVGTVREKMGEATDWTQEHAQDLGHQVMDQARSLKGKTRSLTRRARLGFWETMEESPLMVGAATLAVGVVAGLLIPETEKEKELMGETRDHLMEEVKEAGQETWEKGKHVAGAVADKVKDAVKSEGLTPEGMADKVRNVAHEAADTAKEEARNQHILPGSEARQQEPAAAARP